MAYQVVDDKCGCQNNPPVIIYVAFAGTAAPAGFGIFNANAVDMAADKFGFGV